MSNRSKLIFGLGLVGLVVVIVVGLMMRGDDEGEGENGSPSSVDWRVFANRDWTPVEHTFENGVTMVLVPPGCFELGSYDGGSNQQPVHEICFDTPFWIDKYEVSNEQFNRLGGQAEQASNWTEDDRPRERITWSEARGFCALRGARLPTEAEWEYAARGPDNLAYPWGNEFVAENVTYEGNSNEQTTPVGSRPNGVSWVGALDMSGNVWEWVSTLYRDYPYDANDGRENDRDDNNLRGLRGGSWLNETRLVHASYRDSGQPKNAANGIGLRCARDYDATEPFAAFDTTALQTLSAEALICNAAFGYGACNPVKANSDWTPVEHAFEDDVPMVFVPAGCFVMGSDDVTTREQPRHEICFDAPFWMDKYEVSNEQFNRLGGQAEQASAWTEDDRPRETITWFEARDFCALRGARLPTEAEWEYAARGPDNLMFPWGNELVEANVVYADNSNDQTAPVGSRPNGISWVGALDMLGNVWEWVSTLYEDYPYDANDGRENMDNRTDPRVMRGSSWSDGRRRTHVPFRASDSPNEASPSIGVRCVRVH